MFSKVKNFFTGLKSKTKTVALTASATAVTSSVGMIAMAATSGNSNTKKIIGNVLGYVMAIFRYIGYVLAAWGVGQLVSCKEPRRCRSGAAAVRPSVFPL